MKKFCKDYDELEDFLIKELSNLSHGELKPFCEKNNLSQSEISRFRQRNLPTTRPFFLQEILTALGYTNIEIKPKVFYYFSKE